MLPKKKKIEEKGTFLNLYYKAITISTAKPKQKAQENHRLISFVNTYIKVFSKIIGNQISLSIGIRTIPYKCRY